MDTYGAPTFERAPSPIPEKCDRRPTPEAYDGHSHQLLFLLLWNGQLGLKYPNPWVPSGLGWSPEGWVATRLRQPGPGIGT